MSANSSLTALILAGGLGTRLRPLVADRPKALAPVAGRPFLAWQLEALRQAGIGRVHLSAGHLADQLEAWVARHSSEAFPLSVYAEATPLGTGGAVKANEPFLPDTRFVVLNGDSLLPRLDLAGMQKAHLAAGRLATLAVVRVEQAGQYGTVEFDADGNLVAFREKAWHEDGWVNGGLYLFEHALLDRLEAGTPCSLEHDVFTRWIGTGEIGVYTTEPPLLDMGTPEGLKALEQYLLEHSP